jgi:hypothetical protein
MIPFNHNEYIELASTGGRLAVTIGTHRSLAVDPVGQAVTHSHTDDFLTIDVEDGATFRFPAADVEDLAEALHEALTGWRTLRLKDRNTVNTNA